MIRVLATTVGGHLETLLDILSYGQNYPADVKSCRGSSAS